MKYDVCYAIYDENDDIVGIALSEAEAMYQVWQQLMNTLVDEEELANYLELNDYDTLEELEEDWYDGSFGYYLADFRYEEYQIFNDLGIE